MLWYVILLDDVTYEENNKVPYEPEIHYALYDVQSHNKWSTLGYVDFKKGETFTLKVPITIHMLDYANEDELADREYAFLHFAGTLKSIDLNFRVVPDKKSSPDMIDNILTISVYK